MLCRIRLIMFSHNMPFNLLHPDKTLAAYATFTLKFFCVTVYMRLQILFDFGAEIVTNSANIDLARMSFCMGHQVPFMFEVSVTALLCTNPGSNSSMYDLVGCQFTFKHETFFAIVTAVLLVQVVRVKMPVSGVRAQYGWG